MAAPGFARGLHALNAEVVALLAKAVKSSGVAVEAVMRDPFQDGRD